MWTIRVTDFLLRMLHLLESPPVRGSSIMIIGGGRRVVSFHGRLRISQSFKNNHSLKT